MGTNVRVDYKAERNLKIYNEYLKGESLNTLGDKYKLSPQRISKIIQDVVENGLDKSLTNGSSKKDREATISLALKLREQGNLTLALNLFEKVLAWDKTNNHKSGYINTLGHIRITLDRLGLHTENTKDRQDYFRKAAEVGKEALDLAKKEKDSGKIAISSVHYASSLLALSMSKKTRNEGELKEAIKALDRVIKDFPGSEAHKSWPLKLKAEILTELEEPKEAFELLNKAELCILNGYKNELKDAHGAINLQIWLSGIWLAKSAVCIKLKYPILAKMYAESVLGLSDNEKILGERKKEAKLIVKSFS